MLTSDFIFTFVFSIIKVEQVLSLLSNLDGICRFFFTFSLLILIKSAEGLVGSSGVMLEREVYNLALQGHSVFVLYFLKGKCCSSHLTITNVHLPQACHQT